MRANREWKDWSSRNFSLDKNKLVWHEYWNFISVSKTFRVVKYTVGFIISVCLKMGFCGRINPTQFHKEQSIYDCDSNSAFFSFMELYFNYVIFFIVTKLRLGWEGISIAFWEYRFACYHLFEGLFRITETTKVWQFSFLECSCNKTGQGTLAFL